MFYLHVILECCCIYFTFYLDGSVYEDQFRLLNQSLGAISQEENTYLEKSIIF